MVVVVMGILGVAGSEGELAEEVVRLRGRVLVQFGACGCAWRDDEERVGATPPPYLAPATARWFYSLLK